MVDTNYIHPTAVIGDGVKLGSNNQILAYSILEGPLEIGSNNKIGPHVVIGTPGQNTLDPHYELSGKIIKIGDNNIIREFTAIQKPCFTDLTSLGSNNFLMQSVHVPHDAVIEENVTLTPSVILAGSAVVLSGATLGLGVTVHQNSVIGQYSMVAMNSVVVRNVKPFSKYIWGKGLAVNKYAIKKYHFEDYEEEIKEYVLKNAEPKSDFLCAIVEHYKQFHSKSSRTEHHS